MDQETLAFGYYQKDNQFTDIMGRGNPMNWETRDRVAAAVRLLPAGRLVLQ